jgi:hypothetical protein
MGWVVSFTPRPLYPQGKSPWYPLDRRLGGTQSRSGRGGEEKNSQLPPGIEPYTHKYIHTYIHNLTKVISSPWPTGSPSSSRPLMIKIDIFSEMLHFDFVSKRLIWREKFTSFCRRENFAFCTITRCLFIFSVQRLSVRSQNNQWRYRRKTDFLSWIPADCIFRIAPRHCVQSLLHAKHGWLPSARGWVSHFSSGFLEGTEISPSFSPPPLSGMSYLYRKMTFTLNRYTLKWRHKYTLKMGQH